MSQPTQAAPAAQTATLPGDTLIPMGVAQPNVRDAYRAVLEHLYDGGRVHWAAATFGGGSLGLFQPGDLIVPDAQLSGGYTSLNVASAPPISRAYALRPGGVALLGSSVVVTLGQNRLPAMWELAEVRQILDGYLLGQLPYTTLDEAAIAGGGLAGADLLIAPAVRADAVLSVAQALSATGALDAIRDFVQDGGTLYAQSNAAYFAEAAGLLPPGTVDQETMVELDPGSEPNQGQMEIHIPGSPLAWSWLTETLYILTDPLLHPDAGMEVVASLSNAADAPAVVRASVGQGQVILVAGHPTDEARRLGAPLFMDAVLLALAQRAELTGDAIQTFNPAHPPHEFPAYERVPISVTLTAANLWDAPISGVIVTETVSEGYTVLTDTITPPPAAVYTVTSPATATIIAWDLGQLGPGAQVRLSYWAESAPDALAAGEGVFSVGAMSYLDVARGPVTVVHRPFVLTAQMAPRLVGDRDLEADRHYGLPATGIYLDLALPLENKEWGLAPSVIVTEWVYLVHPFVDLENQHVILNSNDGETIWMLNEPFLWNNEHYPRPVGAISATHTYTLGHWQGDTCVFTSAHGIHTNPLPGRAPLADDLGSFITIPPSLTDYITVTAEDELLLPCLPLTFDLGPWPGYWYETPALRYGVHSRELFGRSIVFHGTPRPEPDVVVLPYDAGSVYVAAGADPVPFREYLPAAVPYSAAPPALPGVAYQDVWSRTHFMPLRAAFYDVWDWDTCATCNEGGLGERHAALNLTYDLLADLDQDGVPETPVREVPTRLPQTWVRLQVKSYNLGQFIPADMNLIELPIFHGLGVEIRPRNGDWFDSFSSSGGHTALLTVTESVAYDHLFFQQNVPPGATEIFYVDAAITPNAADSEGMLKLHDGARLIFRQMLAGPNRYEIYDSHVHSPLGLASNGQIEGWVGPTAVSVYGDSVFYIYTIKDRYDPRPFDEDPYMNSWGYGDFVATAYLGGREQKTLLRSIVTSHDWTRARVSLDNNTGLSLTNVLMTLDAPDWITVTQIYTDPATAPEPIWPELAFLSLETIPDAWSGVYYFDLQVGDVPTGLLGSVITLPVQLQADGLPQDYAAPPLALALRDANGDPPDISFGPANDLTFTETLPSNVTLRGLALADAGESLALANATDFDALHPLSDTAAAIFAALAPTLPFSVDDSVVTVQLPRAWRTLPASETLRIAARATITRANHGSNPVGDGGAICYTDHFGLRWCDQGQLGTVYAAGAVVNVDYFCAGGSAQVQDDGAGHCAIPPGGSSELALRVTAYNVGDALARDVTATLELPAGVTLLGDAGDLDLGDIAPGGWSNAWVTLRVTPSQSGGEITEQPSGLSFLIVNRTQGQFLDTFSQLAISGQFGDEYAVSVLWRPSWVYLPIILRNLDTRPDLVVTSLAVDADDPGSLQVTIANLGLSAAREPFWMDLYLDPAAPPDVNQSWPELCDLYGATWQIDYLGAGESLTLAIGDQFYDAEYSQWPTHTYPAGDHALWVYVDSWGAPNPWAAVHEANESNNRFGPTLFTVEGALGAMFEQAPGRLIPSRPSRPGK